MMTKKVTRDVVQSKAKWLDLCDQGIIRPYTYFRPENQISHPGSYIQNQQTKFDWFPWEPIWKNPLDPKEIQFAEQIFHLENTAFGPQAMPIPRWVFYDCAVMPGFIAGFAMQTSKLPVPVRKVFLNYPDLDWTPLSLFIIIPSLKKGEWVAHNLCAVNSLLPAEHRFYGLGFFSKAFGLWYANVQTCCGVTQWGNPALKLHSHYGNIQVLTAYTPVHTHSHTMTYRSYVDPLHWERFFNRQSDPDFKKNFTLDSAVLDPGSEASMRSLHARIIGGEADFYLSAEDVAKKELQEPLQIFRSS